MHEAHLCAQRRADGRRWVGLAGRQGQLYQPSDCAPQHSTQGSVHGYQQRHRPRRMPL